MTHNVEGTIEIFVQEDVIEHSAREGEAMNENDGRFCGIADCLSVQLVPSAEVRYRASISEMLAILDPECKILIRPYPGSPPLVLRSVGSTSIRIDK